LQRDTKQRVEERKKGMQQGYWNRQIPDRPGFQRAAAAKQKEETDAEEIKRKLNEKREERECLQDEKGTEIARLTERLKKLEIRFDEKLSENLIEIKALEKELAHLKGWPQHDYTNSSCHRLR
jgi:hypothetical protein